MTLERNVLVVSDFIQQFLSDIHRLLLLLVSEQPRHKFAEICSTFRSSIRIPWLV
jgi:hypothetical protein